MIVKAAKKSQTARMTPAAIQLLGWPSLSLVRAFSRHSAITGGGKGRYPFDPVNLMPSIKVRWAKKKAMTTGMVKTTEAAIIWFQMTLCWA